jgi:hypothetical protein
MDFRSHKMAILRDVVTTTITAAAAYETLKISISFSNLYISKPKS